MAPAPLQARASAPLKGAVDVPGDKSISHRALILAGLAPGQSRIRGLLTSDDVLRTAAALRALGVSVERDKDEWTVTGGAWKAPRRALYFGNSGTGCRLLMGAVTGAGISASFDGDGSLRRRPMGRVIEPLSRMGANISSQNGSLLPVQVLQRRRLDAIDYVLPTASAQVKSAILLAALAAEGETVLREAAPSRDHTEKMLTAFGAKVTVERLGDGRLLRLEGPIALTPTTVDVPGDPSSAAFLIAAALIVPGSDVLIRNVLLNPLRTGFFEAVREMGGDLRVEHRRAKSGEEVADIGVRHSRLSGVFVPAERAPSMIDEYPILAVLAAFAKGETRMEGLSELRVKECDRLAAIVEGLATNGVVTSNGEDWLSVKGSSADVKGGATVNTRADHRIAMSFLVMGLAAKKPIFIDDCLMIATSFPGFADVFAHLGAKFGAA